jgi:hypothetical protein
MQSDLPIDVVSRVKEQLQHVQKDAQVYEGLLETEIEQE